MNSLTKLRNKNKEGKFVCVGLDTDFQKLPSHIQLLKNPVYEFNKQIINATITNAAAYKINFAFYEKDGPEGMEILKRTIELIPSDILIIGDAKRGDIGNTSEMYAKTIFEYYKCDASTLHPYMGGDSIKPFLRYDEKLNFILALTSNPGAADFEKLELKDGSPLFLKVIEKVNEWNVLSNCGIVFGATNINELKKSIPMFNNSYVLLPGVGAQGGSIEEVIRAFKEHNRYDLLINMSRGIIYKSNNIDFAEAASAELVKMNEIVKNIIDE